MAELILHTLEPGQAGAALRPGAHPYEPIVGITAPGEATVWDRNPYTLEAIDPANPAGTVAQSFDVPADIGTRAGRFLGDRIMLTRHLPLDYRILLQYNCHSFASSIADDRPAINAFFGERRARKIIEAGVEATSPPAAGRQLVIGGIGKARLRRGIKGKPEHSMISLGPDDPRCLQVTSLWGYMALARYDNLFRSYGVGEKESDSQVYLREAS